MFWDGLPSALMNLNFLDVLQKHIYVYTHLNHVFRTYLKTNGQKLMRADGKRSGLISAFRKIKNFEKIFKNGCYSTVIVIFIPNFEKFKSYA